jgi:hypothetical protein
MAVEGSLSAALSEVTAGTPTGTSGSAEVGSLVSSGPPAVDATSSISGVSEVSLPPSDAESSIAKALVQGRKVVAATEAIDRVFPFGGLHRCSAFIRVMTRNDVPYPERHRTSYGNCSSSISNLLCH